VRAEIGREAWDLFARQGYEATTVAQIAEAASISRRTFFRYYASKEDVLVETTDELAEELLGEVARRPAHEAPLLAIHRALLPVARKWLVEDAALSRAVIRLLRESRTLRRAMLERHARMEERLAALLARRLGVKRKRDSRPALLAFLARAMVDTAFNVWYDQRRKDVDALVDELFRSLAALAPTGGARGRGGERA
jgi:AcrR family transcriptional regulator